MEMFCLTDLNFRVMFFTLDFLIFGSKYFSSTVLSLGAQVMAVYYRKLKKARLNGLHFSSCQHAGVSSLFSYPFYRQFMRSKFELLKQSKRMEIESCAVNETRRCRQLKISV